MGQSEQEFLEKLRAAFTVEAEEHLQEISSGLLEMERSPTSADRESVTETIYRAAHSLKGAARAVNLTEIESICQSLESLLSVVKQETITLTSNNFDTIHKALDTIGQVLSAPEQVAEGTVERVSNQLVRIAEGEAISEQAPEVSTSDVKKPVSPLPPKSEETRTEEPESDNADNSSLSEKESGMEEDRLSAPKSAALSETIRVSTAKLDSLLLQAEEILAVKLTLQQRVVDLLNILGLFEPIKKERAKISPDMQSIRQKRRPQAGGCDLEPANQEFDRVWEFLEWSHAHVDSLENELNGLAQLLRADHRFLSRMVDDLLQDAKNVMLLPFSWLLQAFPKMVRDISRDHGKEARLQLLGQEVEVDKRILERMKDPLVHLLRNCLDHGIEKPDVRERYNKPPVGTITVAVSQVEGDKVEILVSDDGGGVDPTKLKLSAVKHGAISEQEAAELDDESALSLVFRSEVSTSHIITDLSGRGLGLAIVREAVEQLGGRVTVESQQGVGTSFRMLIPLTLSTFRGIVIRASGSLFVVPTANVERVVRIDKEDIRTVESRETVTLDERPISLVRCGDVLGLSRPDGDGNGATSQPALVIGAGDNRIAFLVDGILDEQEVLVKGLGKQLARVRNVAGTTTLGSGTVVPVLNVPDLVKSAVRADFKAMAAGPTVTKTASKKNSVLVVEDSITSRMLLKSILESAGYDVRVALDGVDAWTSLKEERTDLVVSDIMMPRMDGFELTTKIREDDHLAETPVVLVSGLESREDRDRGIDVGANAYIVKSSFDQSNLLNVIQKLV